ncbi:ABC transporter substrate-binding protein [Microbacterium oleivorans]|uniref:ABC-type glycine betaine transport, periplasmic subunit n=1 Tax=Microbacterium oleivorans TaxID=273677 RepID=A0A031G0D8_9MICO|nr:ABC transporter substrate-binding protein [Microbacterium oleivorans]AZS44021.1 Glycine betaine-binding protein YehZ [Microbacterium oleivorans]EZP29936.1 ABC-type glycine betaine transport, periplasmic subunit precursor [Microbacterium oleivorans]
MSITRNRILPTVGLAAVAVFALSACGSSDSLQGSGSNNNGGNGGETSKTIVVGSQAYPSNEIIAEIYAQALEGDGFTVERNFSIGQRDAYMPSLEDGSIDLFPEYTGNLLQYFDKDAKATTADDVYAALEKALPDNLKALDYSPATDQDSYNVTAAFAKKNNLTEIGDLAGITGLTFGGAPELEKRPYFTDLEKVYGVTAKFEATADTTVDELVAGNIQVANVYSADPAIKTKDLVTLKDPKGLFLASNVVPIANADKADEIAGVINKVSAAMSPEELVAMNVESTVDQRSSEDIAKKWIADNLG